MIEHLQTVQKIHQLVWSYRRKPELAAAWPTPSPKASLRFAVTEAAEALDAEYLRSGEFARNNERESDTLAELADVAIMLATALGPTFPTIGRNETIGHVGFARTLDSLCYRVASANVAMYEDWHGNREWIERLIMQALDIVCHLFGDGPRFSGDGPRPGGDVLVYVEDKLNRTYHKFVQGASHAA